MKYSDKKYRAVLAKNQRMQKAFSKRFEKIKMYKIKMSTIQQDIVKSFNEDGHIALMRTSRHGKTECVELLLKDPTINVNHADEYGYTALIYASRWGKTQCVELLLKQPNINVNHVTKYSKTALIYACLCGNTKCVELLLKHPNIDVNYADKDGKTALIYASKYDYTDIVNMIKEYKYEKNHERVFALHESISSHDIHVPNDILGIIYSFL